MGASSSKIEEDKALQLCRERKKFVRQALDGRCSLAAAHVTYVQSLRSTATALRKFVEPEGPVESSLYTSTSQTPEPLALTEKSLYQFSLSSPTFSQKVDATENLCPSPSPPHSGQFQGNCMKFRGITSKKVEEKPPTPVNKTVISSSTLQNSRTRDREKSELSPYGVSASSSESRPWDFFVLQNHEVSSQEGKNQGLENIDDFRRLREEEGVPELEDEGSASFHGREESIDSDDEFEEPSLDTLVRSFKNLNGLHNQNAPSASPTMPSAGTVASESEFRNGEKNNSPDLSPVRATASRAAFPTGTKKTPLKDDFIENKVTPKDFFSSMKDIEHLFIKASESGKEVPRMLEANKLHFRPIFPAKESESMASTFFKACFSCKEDHIQVQEEPAQNAVKYLTWHRTESSRSSSSRNPLGLNSKDEVEDLSSNVFDSIYMISASHASTLDRLYAWERKLYDEVKASEMVRREYDSKCKILRQLESKGESLTKIDKTRAVVKDLHSRIRVAIHRIDSISKRIEELRDTELQSQLEELIGELGRMWEVMFECHSLQFHIISEAYNNGDSKIFIQSDSHRQITIHLEDELSYLSSSFTKWIGAQIFYVRAINNWLFKCVSLAQKSSRRKRQLQRRPSLKNYIPIYATCEVWLELMDKLPTKKVTDSIKSLAAETIRFLPRQEKNQGKSATRPSTSWNADNSGDSTMNTLTDAASDDLISGFDHFQSSLVGFIGQLSNFAEESVKMYAQLKQAINDAKSNYSELISRDAKNNTDQVPAPS